MNTCDTCKHWKKDARHRAEKWDLLGNCSSENWLLGYHVEQEEFKPDSIIVENDEGWAFQTGPKFGCVHHTARDSQT